MSMAGKLTESMIGDLASAKSEGLVADVVVAGADFEEFVLGRQTGAYPLPLYAVAFGPVEAMTAHQNHRRYDLEYHGVVFTAVSRMAGTDESLTGEKGLYALTERVFVELGGKIPAFKTRGGVLTDAEGVPLESGAPPTAIARPWEFLRCVPVDLGGEADNLLVDVWASHFKCRAAAATQVATTIASGVDAELNQEPDKAEEPDDQIKFRNDFE